MHSLFDAAEPFSGQVIVVGVAASIVAARELRRLLKEKVG